MSQPETPSQYTRRTKVAAGCIATLVSALILVPVLACVGAIVFLFTSCSFNKALVASDLPRPDHAFQTGSVAGYKVYLWDCVQNKHIVVYNATGEFYRGAYKRQESACGTTTPIEEQLAPDRKRELDPALFSKEL